MENGFNGRPPVSNIFNTPIMRAQVMNDGAVLQCIRIILPYFIKLCRQQHDHLKEVKNVM